jgi:hypothetical protein
MVYCFVKQSRGHVKIYSEAGHGTCIRIYLPRSTGLAATASAPAPVVGLKGREATMEQSVPLLSKPYRKQKLLEVVRKALDAPAV